MGDPLDTFYARHGKRLFDLLAGGAGTVAVSPLLAVLAAVVYLDSGRPIFFRQERVGLNGQVFRIFKFRTMVPNAAATTSKRATPASPAAAPGCAPPAWTSCRSSSTWCSAT